MGATLPLIITFNLALAHHLNTIEGMAKKNDHNINPEQLQKILRLYELTYRWQTDSEDDESVDSIYFSLAIANNLAEIHRVTNNKQKHLLCLEHLLSTIMYVVDCNDETQSRDSASPMELEGFFQNASELILHEQAAGAA